jgi:hypothetical protein
MKRIITVAIAVLLTASFTEANDTVKLLTVGNSFSVNSTKYLADIAEASGCTLIKGTANLGGCSLERHWNHAVAYEADPASPEGKPYNGRSLKEILESDKWDVVTIQQYSWISDDIETYRPYAQNLYDYIKKYAPQAEVMIHQTWAYRADDTGKYRGGYDQVAMHKNIRENYHAIAKDLGIRIIPVGEAFANARSNPDWNFERDPAFDYTNPKNPEIPNEKQSLCKGFNWPNDKKWSIDTHHAGLLGEYLGGAVFFEMLFDKSVIGNSFRPPNATEEDIHFLQQIAHDTVADQRNTKPNP